MLEGHRGLDLEEEGGLGMEWIQISSMVGGGMQVAPFYILRFWLADANLLPSHPKFLLIRGNLTEVFIDFCAESFV